MNKYLLGSILFGLLMGANFAKAQTKYATEQHFHELFVTAGYSTAFGAALGAAALGLTDNPGEKLQYIATGASLGFIMGSVVGTYVILAPSVSYGSSYSQNGTFGSLSDQPKPLEIAPQINLTKAKLDGFRLSWRLTEF
ncbi:MAG: hypothetical protein HRU09_01820 [Oligoflexales bacterium]|nr:hypothetical protein [Oligoflexales bacterium]